MEELLNNPYLGLAAVLTVVNTIGIVVLILLYVASRSKGADELESTPGDSLGETISKNQKLLAVHNKNLREIGKLLEEIVEKNKLNVQKIGMVRYNPFANTGGNMSFVIALLDGHDNGILISSLHSREGTRIYGKSLALGKSESNLTEEEKQAIAQAQKNISR